MNTQQTFFVVGAIILMGILLLPAHRVTIHRSEVLISSEATLTANAIGQELLEEIYDRRFDEKMNRNTVDTNAATQCSWPIGLETAAGDTAGKLKTYDDIDDFNNYTRTVTTPRLGAFIDSVKVYYVAENQPEVDANTRTWLKRIDIKVRNSYIPSTDNTITISKIVAYRYR